MSQHLDPRVTTVFQFRAYSSDASRTLAERLAITLDAIAYCDRHGLQDMSAMFRRNELELRGKLAADARISQLPTDQPRSTPAAVRHGDLSPWLVLWFLVVAVALIGWLDSWAVAEPRHDPHVYGVRYE